MKCDCCRRELASNLPYYVQSVSAIVAVGSGKDRKAVGRGDEVKVFCTKSCVSRWGKVEGFVSGPVRD